MIIIYLGILKNISSISYQCHKGRRMEGCCWLYVYNSGFFIGLLKVGCPRFTC